MSVPLPVTKLSLTRTHRTILHDEKRYRDPDRFDPGRFLTSEGSLDKSVPDPTEVFGYGRRICPGRYFAQDALWCISANILAVFSVEKPLDEHGNVMEPSAKYTSGLVR